MAKFGVLIISMLLLLATFTQAKKCKALALEGGGDKGAYQAGAIRGLYEALGQAEGTYDVLNGVSIGAINAVGYSVHKEGDEDTATQWLCKY